MAQYVATRAAPKGLPVPVDALILDAAAQLGAGPAASAAAVLQAVHAVLADVLGTAVAPDQPLMQVSITLQPPCHWQTLACCTLLQVTVV